MNNKFKMTNFKWVLCFCGFLLVVFCFQGCIKRDGQDVERGEDKLRVVVSVIPQKYFVEKIGGDKVLVTYMVEKGASPATYEPRPAQMEEVSLADAYISVGVPFEEAWLDKFEAANDQMIVFDQGAGVSRLELPLHARQEEPMSIHQVEDETYSVDESEDLIDQGTDPHIWLSVKEASTQAENIYRALSDLDPKNEDYYRANLESFQDEILELDKEMALILKPVENKSFLVFHPAFSYIARDYGLNQIAIEIEGKEPSVREMEEIIGIAEEENIKTIFVEPQFSKKSAEAVVEEIEAVVVEIDPLAEEWDDNLKGIAEAIARAE